MVVIGVVILALLIAGTVAAALWLVGRAGGEIPPDWPQAEFRIEPVSPGQEVSPRVRDDVGLMLVGRLHQRGAAKARYEVHPDGVDVGVPPGQESALADLRRMAVTTTVELRPVTGEERTPDGCVPDADLACALDGLTGYRLGPVEIDGTHLADAQAELDDQTGTWSIELTWTGEGQSAVERTTTAYVQEQLAITANGIVVYAPRIQEPVTGDTLLISGFFDQGQAEHLAAELRLGRLPVSIIGDQAT